MGKKLWWIWKIYKISLYEGSLGVLINFCCPRSHLLPQLLSFRSYFHIEIKARGKIGVCRGRGRWTSKSSNPSLSYDPLFYYLLFFFFILVSLFFFFSFTSSNMTSRYSRVWCSWYPRRSPRLAGSGSLWPSLFARAPAKEPHAHSVIIHYATRNYRFCKPHGLDFNADVSIKTLGKKRNLFCEPTISALTNAFTEFSLSFVSFRLIPFFVSATNIYLFIDDQTFG